MDPLSSSLNYDTGSTEELHAAITFLHRDALFHSVDTSTEYYDTQVKIDRSVAPLWDEFLNTPLPPLPNITVKKLSKNRSSDAKRKVKDQKNKAYICPITDCGRRYKYRGDLASHFRKKHHKNPSYASLAGKIFTPRSSKIGKPFPCPFESCPSGFAWERDCQRHVKLKHTNPVINDVSKKPIVWVWEEQKK